jgi:hypothetical protein
MLTGRFMADQLGNMMAQLQLKRFQYVGFIDGCGG